MCFINKGKENTFMRVKAISLLTGINFSLTNFPDGCQTLENEETEFLKFSFLETNKA